MKNAECPYAWKASPFSSHGRILAQLLRLPRDRRILDVGAATGYLGSALRQAGFHSVSGIEMNPEWAREAKPFYQSLEVCDLERDPLPWEEGSFDVLICADVLEHLKDPAGVLRRLQGLLAAGGMGLVSLPNVAHWSVRLSLLFGRFSYEPAGILDKSHLRFFTRSTACALLRQAGLRIQSIAPIPLPVDRWQGNPFGRRLTKLFERFDYGMGRLLPGLFAFQILFTARAEQSRDAGYSP